MVESQRQTTGKANHATSNGIKSIEAYRLALSICRNHHIAEEAVQEAMIKMVCSGRFTDRGKGSFKAWAVAVICNAARNASIKESRLKARERRYANDHSMCHRPCYTSA